MIGEHGIWNNANENMFFLVEIKFSLEYYSVVCFQHFRDGVTFGDKRFESTWFGAPAIHLRLLVCGISLINSLSP